ncbi:MAG: hypothetical protein Q8P61_01920 [Candidatus Nanopelagicales bacterium]|nr:hypothetical protein [Candidatus Nanopelagicales bacterium]
MAQSPTAREQIKVATEWMCRAALTSPDQNAVPALLVRWTRRLCGLDFAAMALPSTDEQYAMRFADGIPAAPPGVMPPDLSSEDIRQVVRNEQPQFISSDGGLEFALIPYWSPWSRRRAVLVIGGTRTGSRGTPVSLDELRRLCDRTATAVQLARNRRKAGATEFSAVTTRAAENLHDHVIQSLVASGFEIQSGALGIADADIRRRLIRTTEGLDAVIERLRGMIFELSHALPAVPANLLDHLLEDTTELSKPAGMSCLIGVDPLIVDWLSEAVSQDIREITRTVLETSADTIPAVAVDVTVEPAWARLRLTIRQASGPAQHGNWRSALSRIAPRDRENFEHPVLADASGVTAEVRWSAPLTPL